jgi:hypothetical protein
MVIVGAAAVRRVIDARFAIDWFDVVVKRERNG